MKTIFSTILFLAGSASLASAATPVPVSSHTLSCTEAGSLTRQADEIEIRSIPAAEATRIFSTCEEAGDPQFAAATFTTVSPTGVPSLTMAGYSPVTVFIDWMGNGTLTQYDLTSEVQNIIGSIGFNKNVTIYTNTQADAENIRVFSIDGIRLKNVDLSPMVGLTTLTVSGSLLGESDIVMPQAPYLGGLNLSGNKFTRYPYADLYPNVSYLLLANNQITEFDPATVPNVENLILAQNKLKSLSFNNPKIWNLQIDDNEIETIDLNGLDALEQVFAGVNRLHTIDLEPVKGHLRVLNVVGNRFYFSTLPIQADYPGLNVFYYGKQAVMDVTLEDMTVNISSEAVVNGAKTTYYWFLGYPEYDEEDGGIYGTVLKEGVDYTLTDGVTTFLDYQSDTVMCLMTNPLFPNLILYTNIVDIVGVDELAADPNAEIEAISLDGIPAGHGTISQLRSSLPHGIYVVNGKKVRF